uniref:RING-type domain-containing protein n=1 Tax=Kalanchoe fedtschenkoi TaxID=63787 RepID=A0A7N0TCA7_KALFE
MGAAADGFDALCFDTHPQMMMMMMFPRPQQQHSDDDSCQLLFAPMIESVGEKQQRQIDQYIISQYETLRLTVHEQMKRDLASILNRIQANSRRMLNQKDEEIRKARNRAAQLELILLKAQTEQQQWQKRALDTESQLTRLNNTIDQMRHNEEGDAESCCDAGERACRSCGIQEARVVLLPCRHMCSCTACESLLVSCPVCRCVKQGAIAIEPFLL